MRALSCYQGGGPENGGAKGDLWHLLEQTGGRVDDLTRLSRLARAPTYPVWAVRKNDEKNFISTPMHIIHQENNQSGGSPYNWATAGAVLAANRTTRQGWRPASPRYALRPWANSREGNVVQWLFRVGPAFRKAPASGVEGAPQTLAKRFAEQWGGILWMPLRSVTTERHRCPSYRSGCGAESRRAGLRRRDHCSELVLHRHGGGPHWIVVLGWCLWMSKPTRSCSILDEWRKQLSPGRLAPSCRFTFLVNPPT